MRNYEKEIDELWEELAGLWVAINAQNIEQRHEQSREAGREFVRIMHNMHTDKRLSEMMEELCETADAEGLSGRIIYNVIL